MSFIISLYVSLVRLLALEVRNGGSNPPRETRIDVEVNSLLLDLNNMSPTDNISWSYT